MTPWFITFHFYRCLWQFFKQKRQLYNLTSPNVRRDVPEIFYSRLKIYLSPVHKLWRTINSRDILPWLFLAVLRYVDQPGDKKIWIMGLREHFFSLILANTFWNFWNCIAAIWWKSAHPPLWSGGKWKAMLYHLAAIPGPPRCHCLTAAATHVAEIPQTRACSSLKSQDF